MTEYERVKAKLEKLNAVVLKKETSEFSFKNKIFVIYNQKGKTKLATFGMNGYYHDRYGPKVIATFNGNHFWFMSNDIANELNYEDFEEMKKVFNGESELLKFDPTVLGELLS